MMEKGLTTDVLIEEETKERVNDPIEEIIHHGVQCDGCDV
jgi:predicted HNH restriction endonuclease